MSGDGKPPFRADQVGSLLRPKALLQMRARRQRGAVGAAALRQAEDAAIDEAVARQDAIGLVVETAAEIWG